MKIGELESRKMRKKLSQRRQNTVEKGVVPKVLKKKNTLYTCSKNIITSTELS